MDLYIFQQINMMVGQSVCLDVLAIFFAKYLVYLMIGCVILLFLKKWKIILQAFLAGLFSRYIIVELIRFFWPRPRPFIENEVNLLVDRLNQAAFPSGHTAFAFALSTVAFLYIKKVYPASKFWRGVGFVFFVASLLIGLSRVFVGVHWPGDILGGALVGIFSGWLVVKIFKKF